MYTVVCAYDFESGRADPNHDWGLIYHYKALISVKGSPEPSFLQGSKLGTRSAEHKGCNSTGACKLIDG